ncbi:MAG: hypothetical protein D6746_07535 [Bacteroidetes bacterium]|nr:MAG: hypothetical protein D6746_07535 [Bacteroidota bacterium]
MSDEFKMPDGSPIPQEAVETGARVQQRSEQVASLILETMLDMGAVARKIHGQRGPVAEAYVKTVGTFLGGFLSGGIHGLHAAYVDSADPKAERRSAAAHNVAGIRLLITVLERYLPRYMETIEMLFGVPASEVEAQADKIVEFLEDPSYSTASMSVPDQLDLVFSGQLGVATQRIQSGGES